MAYMNQHNKARVKMIIKKFMDGKFVLILMTMVTIFAIVGVSYFYFTFISDSRIS